MSFSEEMSQEQYETDYNDDGLGLPQTSVHFDTFEQALKLVGSFGPYHWLFIAVMQMSIVMWCGNFVFMPYATYIPEINCTVNESFTLSYDHRHPIEFCEFYENQQCLNVTWKSQFRTVVEQWKLICSSDYIPELLNSLQMSGTFVALALTGPLSDRFGRKKVFQFGFLLMLLISVSGCLSPDWRCLAASRFLVGGLIASTFMVNFVWSMEVTGERSNFLMNLATLWHFGYIVTALLAFWTNDWKMYLIVLNGCGLPLLFVYTRFVESPRWLIQKGKLETAARHLSRISAGNRPLTSGHYGDNIVQSSCLVNIAQERSAKRKGFCTLLSSRRLLTYTTVLSLVTFATASSAYALVFQIGLLKGNPFAKFAIYGAVRIYIPILLYYLDRKVSCCGRREMIYIPMLIVFLFYLAASLSELLLSESNFIAMLAGAVAGNCLWTGIGQYQMELFPTGLRSTASAVVMMFDPLASVLMPQLIYAQRFYHAVPVLQVSVFTLMALISSYFLLPETKGCPLPDTMEDVAELSFNEALRPWKQLKFHLCGGAEDGEGNLLENIDYDERESNSSSPVDSL